jgi:hypothetical protein
MLSQVMASFGLQISDFLITITNLNAPTRKLGLRIGV